MDSEQQERRTHAALEWALLLERFAERCASRSSADYARALTPAATLEAARVRLARTRQALALADAGHELPARDFPELSDLLERVRAHGVGSGSELAGLTRVLELGRELRAFAKAHAANAPELAAAIDTSNALEPLRERLASSIDPDGQVADRAAPSLAAARAKKRELEADLKRRLAQLLGRYGDLLQGQYYTEREGRYVLPVRSDAHLPVEGIVLGSSSSGGTLFVEPRELTEHANRLRVAEAEAAREEARVLGVLSSHVGELADPCEQAFFACIVADLCRAAARWASETRSVVLELADEPVLDLKRSRHPLLLLGEHDVVANDITLPEHGALIISGPNAGGKTVALKTLGLVAWMARAGLPVPVEATSRLGFFEPVLCDIGDEQSIARSLSTFSAHVQSLSRIVDAAGSRALILLDEVAAGTDPEEGAALAAAVLEALVERGASVAVTTHYERLKELAAEHPRFANASVGFDFERMAPTFRLLLGAAGASSALAVAARHGLSAGILERAHALLPQHAVDRERMLREIGGERAALERLRAEAEQDREQQRALTAELEAERHAFRARAANEAEREVAELRASVRSARKELEAIRKELRKGADRGGLRELERGVSRIAAQVAIGSPLVAPSEPDEPAASPARTAAQLVVGQTVRHRTFGTQGQLLELLDAETARVALGQMKLTVKVSDLVALGGARKAAAQPQRKPRASLPKPLAAAQRTSDNTLDLRGERAEHAETLVEAFIDRMLGSGEPLGFVLHGHGTGALKALVREQLGKSRYIEHSRPAAGDEGGDAFTVFWLRD